MSIDEGRFTADWTGQDSNPDSSALESVRGFVGSLFGEFYGPNGEEVGGVLNGHRDATDTTPEQVVSGDVRSREGIAAHSDYFAKTLRGVSKGGCVDRGGPART